jgi:hypothetical protein
MTTSGAMAWSGYRKFRRSLAFQIDGGRSVVYYWVDKFALRGRLNFMQSG